MNYFVKTILIAGMVCKLSGLHGAQSHDFNDSGDDNGSDGYCFVGRLSSDDLLDEGSQDQAMKPLTFDAFSLLVANEEINNRKTILLNINDENERALWNTAKENDEDSIKAQFQGLIWYAVINDVRKNQNQNPKEFTALSERGICAMLYLLRTKNDSLGFLRLSNNVISNLASWIHQQPDTLKKVEYWKDYAQAVRIDQESLDLVVDFGQVLRAAPSAKRGRLRSSRRSFSIDEIKRSESGNAVH